MITIVIAVFAVLVVGLIVTTRKWMKAVGRRRAQGYGRPWPIRRVRLEDVDPVFIPDGELGHLPATTEVAFVGHAVGLLGATTDYEAWILAVLSRSATTMFEFGTCTGRTTYLLARNSPPDARVVTLTLAPNSLDVYQPAAGDTADDAYYARAESTCDRFVYTGTPVEGKVVQLYGDSKAFDETPYIGRCDLIFVDGSHAYSYTQSDSAKALRMIAPGGLILWHDYAGGPDARGSFRALNDLATELPLVHIAGTTLVVYRSPNGRA
jgi:methyltransferase family protein